MAETNILHTFAFLILTNEGLFDAYDSIWLFFGLSGEVNKLGIIVDHGHHILVYPSSVVGNGPEG